MTSVAFSVTSNIREVSLYCIFLKKPAWRKDLNLGYITSSVKQMNTLFRTECSLLVRRLDEHLHVHSRIETEFVRELSAPAVAGA